MDRSKISATRRIYCLTASPALLKWKTASDNGKETLGEYESSFGLETDDLPSEVASTGSVDSSFPKALKPAFAAPFASEDDFCVGEN